MQACDSEGKVILVHFPLPMSLRHLLRAGPTYDTIGHRLGQPLAPVDLHLAIGERSFAVEVNSQAVVFKRLDIFGFIFKPCSLSL